MGTRNLTLPLLLAVVLSSVLLGRSHSAGSQEAASTPRVGTGKPSPAAAVSAAPAEESDDPTDVIDLLADSYGIDTSSAGLQRRASWSARASGNKTRPDAVQKEFDGFLQDVSSLSRKTMPLSPEAARLAVAGLNNRDETALKIRLLERQLAFHDSNVRYLIATLPDPIDSYTGWQFDPMLDGMLQAVAASNYILDRFALPDTQGSNRRLSASARRHVHDEEPGVIVFRRQWEKDYAQPTCFRRQRTAKPTTLRWQDRLVLLVVYENPTAGIHPRALSRAINWVDNWPGSPECEPVAIMGPTFSGSTESMSRALEMARDRGITRPIRIISGSATDDLNKSVLERTDDVTFHATVNPDSILTQALIGQFDALQWSHPLGLLFEANTQYGRQLADAAKDAVEQALRKGTESPLGSGKAPIKLPFPMNISRLRTTADQKPDDDNALGLPLTMRPLPMEEKENPTDKIPEFFPNTASTYIALGLARMLETLKQDGVRSVAIMATDPRDKLYLAQQLALHRPGVSILTAESDSIYLHPDYSAYMRGALVASTYPLYGALQHWTYGTGGYSAHREFANDAAQGIYNATLALLNYDDDPSGDLNAPAVASAPNPPPLIDYGTPETPCTDVCGPPMWLSVVGRTSTLPVRAEAYRPFRPGHDGKPTGNYVFEVGVPLNSRITVAGSAPFPSPFLDAAFLIASLAILCYCGFARLVRHGSKAAGRGRHRHQLALLYADPASRGRGSFLAAIAGVCAIESMAAMIWWARIHVGHMMGATGAFALALGCLFALVDVSYPIAARFVTDDLTRTKLLRPERFGITRPATWAALGLIALAGSALSGLVMYEMALIREHNISFMIGFIARAADPTSGVCPTLPVVMLAAAVTLWGAIELTRLRSSDVVLARIRTPIVTAPSRANEPPTLVDRTVTGQLDRSRHWELLDRSIVTVPWRLGLIAAAAAGTIGAFSFDPWVWPLITVEGPIFGRLVSAMTILADVLVSLALIQFVCLWLSIRQLLERMAWHPIAEAFNRVPRELFPKGLLVRTPKPMELQRLVAFWDARFSTAPTRLEAAFENDMKDQTVRWSSTRTWQELYTYASVSAPVATAAPQLAVAVAGSASAVAISSTSLPSSSPNVPTPRDDAPTPHGELVAMSMTLVIRDALARLGYNLVFVVAAVLLVFGSHALFPFRERQSLAALDWIFIGATFTAIIVVLVQMKRNDIIGRLTAKVTGERTTWDAEFILKVTVFWLLPLLTLFAAQFPEIGGTLLHWLQPVEKALP